jgi:hypothetical protein
VWVAENVSTFLGAWAYPDQLVTWQPVHLGKLTSWSLLVIVTVVIVGEHLRTRGALGTPLPRRVRGPAWAWLPAFLGGAGGARDPASGPGSGAGRLEPLDLAVGPAEERDGREPDEQP